VPNFAESDNKDRFERRSVIIIKPIICAGAIREKEDGWTLVTIGGAMSAHFEETIIDIRDGSEIVPVFAHAP
jgi:methionyl aminopeptidase